MSTLPSGWAQATTDALFTFVTSGSRGWARYYSDEGAPFIRIGNLQRGSITPDLADLQRVSPPAGAEGVRTQVESDDILISITADLGRIALMTDIKETTYINQHVALARPIKAINPRYVAWYLSSELAQRQWGEQQRGVTRLGLGLENIRSVKIPIPPLAEQARIVAAIEEQFSRLDVGTLALRRARQNVKRMRAAVLEAAVRGRLFATEEAPIIVDHSDAAKLPLGWTIVPVRDIAEVSGGITKNPKRLPRTNAIPFLRVANVKRDQLDLREVHEIEVFDGELERLRLEQGDLLVVEGNGSPDQIGRSALWDGSIDPCVHQNHLIRVRPENKILPEYLNIFWNAPSSMATIQAAASSTSGLHTLSTGKIRNIQVALPPLPVQHRIIEEVDRQLSALSALDQQLGIVEARGRVLRAATLATAFSGNLVPQDPADEDASALLERIAAERTTSNALRARLGRKPRVLREEVPA